MRFFAETKCLGMCLKDNPKSAKSDKSDFCGSPSGSKRLSGLSHFGFGHSQKAEGLGGPFG